MQTAEFDHNDFDTSKQGEADAKLLVRFLTHSIPDQAATLENGRPMFKDVEVIDIRVPGQRDGVVRKATPNDKQRFPRHYAAFQQRIEAPIEGTPLTEWPAVSRSFAEQLSYENIKTVEQLSELNDNLMHRIPGIANFKQKAKDWLEATKDDAVLGRLREELNERDEKITEMAAQLDGLLAKVEALSAEGKPTKKGK